MGEDIKEGLTNGSFNQKCQIQNFHHKLRINWFNKIRNIVKTIVSDKVSVWFDQNPGIVKAVLEKVLQAAIARDLARKGER